MGGYNSGRRTGMPTVEDGLTLDINRLIRHRNFRPGSRVSGILNWTYVNSGEKVASISYEASLEHPETAWARLHYTSNGTPKDYRVQIETTACNYGGVRWWWVCPLSGRRAAKLYLPPGASVFAARKTYRLPYRSQREAPIDRTHDWQARIHRKLGGKYRYHGDPPPRRPKGMHHKTYARLTEELFAAMEAHERVFAAGASAIMARLTKADARRR